MKVMISKSMGAIATVLALQFAENQNEQEVDLTAEQLSSINQALSDANKKSSDLETKVTNLETKQTELQSEVNRLKAFEPAGTSVDKSKEATVAEQQQPEEELPSVKYAREKLS
jgi:uncharacterized protein (DUF3084 family)